MKITPLLWILLFLCSCKKNAQKQHEIVATSQSQENQKVQTKTKNTSVENDTILKLPIHGGDHLSTITIENDIKSHALQCDFSILKSKLCSADNVSYFQLPKKGELNPIIIEDECGDNSSYILAILKKDKVIDYQLIYSYWVEMSDHPKEEITDFKLSKNYEISISETKLENNIKTKETTTTYHINANGMIEKN